MAGYYDPIQTVDPNADYDPNGISVMSGYAQPGPADGGLQGLVTPAQQQNVMQQISAQTGQMQPIDPNAGMQPDPSVMSGMQPQNPQMDPNAPQAPQAPQVNPMQALAPAAAPPQQAPVNPQQLPDQAAPGGNAPRKRLSAIDVLGRLSDVFAKVGGAPEQYQPYLDQRVKQAQDVASNNLDMDAKRQDIAQTGGQVQDAANLRAGAFARGLKALGAAGRDPVAAAPLLAKQLGIDPAVAQNITNAIQQDPNNLDAIIAATSKPGDADEKFGNTPVYGRDANGNLVLGQISSKGNFKPVDTGSGFTPLETQTVVHQGDKDSLVGSKTGKVGTILPVTGTPKAEDIPVHDAAGNLVGYRTAPGGQGATDADLGNQKLTEAQQKAHDAQVAQAAQYTNSRANLTNLDHTIDLIANDKGLSDATGPLASRIPSYSRNRVHALVDTATGQALQGAMAQLREGSKDGSLGIRLTQKELFSLSDTIGALKNTDQSTSDYRATLQQAKDRIKDIVGRMDAAHAPAAATSKPSPLPANVIPRTGGSTPSAPKGWKISVVN